MNGFRIKLDENLGVSHVALLREAGYDADRVHDEGLSGAPDEDLWQHVQAEGRFFITVDLDFSDLRRYAPGTHAGVLLLRVRSKDQRLVLEVLERVVHEHNLASLHDCFVVADLRITRVRRPLGDS